MPAQGVVQNSIFFSSRFTNFIIATFLPKKSQFDEEDMGNERMGEKRFFKDKYLLIPK